MSWLTAIWSASAGICLTLAGVHFLVWVKSRDAWASLFFSIAAVSAAAISVFEMNMMHASTPGIFDVLLRWSYVPSGLMIVSVAWFVRFYLSAGNIWLIWLLCAIRVLILVLTFTMDSSLHFLEITDLRQVQVWGEIVVTPVGVANPWAYWGNATTLLLIIITLHAAIVAWRRGTRRQAAIVGSTIIGATVLGIMMSVMLAAGMLRMPYSLSLVFLIIVLGMAYELSVSMISAVELSSELNQNRERMRLAAKAANLGLWDWDIVQDEIWATEAGRERVGAGANERINFDRFLKAVHPDDRDALRSTVHHIIERDGELRVAYRMCAPDGAVRWIEASGGVVRSATGTALRVRGVTIDITERKRYEAELEFIKKSIDVSPDGAYWMDVAGKFVYVNDVGCSSLGYSRDEMLRMSIFDIAPLASAEGWREVWKLLREKGKYATETVHRRKDGSEFPVEITSTCVVMAGHEYVSGFARDITDRKKAEQESGQLRLELAHLNRVLTMSELSSSLAHEINQPLGAILNNASTAKILHSRCAGVGVGEVAEILDDIIRDTNRAGQIVRKIRGIIKKENVAFEPMEINTLISEVVGLFHNPLARERISVREELSPDLPLVKGDRVRLQQVIMNLIMNATDAMKGSSSRILTIRTAMQRPDTVLVSIIDTGTGIDDTMKNRMFESFSTTKKDGLGMGLRICRSIIEEHGGRIWAENNPDGGATFTFTLRTDGGSKG